MGIQYADKPKQPGETLRYSMTFTPGKGIAAGDSLTGDPNVKVTRIADGVDVTIDVAGPPAIVGMLVTGSDVRAGNIIYAEIEGGTDGANYKITFSCDTTNGEIAVEEDLVIEVREL